MKPVSTQRTGDGEFELKKPTRWKFWFFLFFLTALLHLLVFLIHVHWGSYVRLPPIEIQKISPAQLNAIRKQWKTKGLLLDQDSHQPSEKKAPTNAEYSSDRNIHVEKEQRAAQTSVTPHPGSSQGNQKVNRSQSIQNIQPQVKLRAEHFPKLGNLGVPFHLDSSPSPSMSENNFNHVMASEAQGGQQYIDDKNLPTGSENLLNAQESIYYSFYARLYEAIAPIWQSLLRQSTPQNRIIPGEYTTSVDVVFDESGNLLDVRVIQSSGVVEFDNVVGKAWRKIQRFPNPPIGLLDAQSHVHTGWSFKVQLGEGIQFLPPARNY